MSFREKSDLGESSRAITFYGLSYFFINESEVTITQGVRERDDSQVAELVPGSFHEMIVE